MKYRKKPVVIDAVQYTGDNSFFLHQWSNGAVNFSYEPNVVLGIPTLEGIMDAKVGDFIICGIKGEYYPCKPDIFVATYELEPEP